MILKTYTVKKMLGEKMTTKSPNGSYDSQENSAEIIMTFESEGSPIVTDECNKKVLEEVHKVLDGYPKKDEEWLDKEPVTTNPNGTHSVGKMEATEPIGD